MEILFSIKGINKNFRKKEVLKNINLEVKKNEIYGIVGNNGVGKTTLLRIICGHLKPSEGEISFVNEKKIKIGALIENPGLFGDMSAFQNLKAKALCLGLKNYNDKINELLALVGLADVGKLRAGKFSKGMKQRLAIALALIDEPELLVLDEPTNGLDPQGITEIRELILRIHKERNVTILISSHILDELMKIATRFCFMKRGEIVKDISIKELQKESKGKTIDEYYMDIVSN